MLTDEIDAWTEDDGGIVKMIEESYEQSDGLWQQYMAEADIDMRLEAGDQMPYNQYGSQVYRQQAQLFFNQIKRLKNMICGYQRKNRKASIVVPQEGEDQDAADQYSGLVQWAMNNDNVYNTISNAFSGAVTCGLNLLGVWLDYRNDPVSGDIRVENFNFSSFAMDPFWSKPDLSDCDWIRTRKWLSRGEVRSLLVNKDSFVNSIPFDGDRDGKYTYMPQSFQYSQRKLLAYDEYWYKSTRNINMLIDEDSGECQEWRGSDEAFELFKKMHPDIKIVTYPKQTVMLAILVNGKLAWHGRNPMSIDRFPFVVSLGYFYPDIQNYAWRYQGIVRGLRDAQYAYNSRKRIELDILQAQVGSGIQAKEDALVNPDDAFLTGPGRVRWIKKTSQMSDVQEINPPTIPSGMFQMSESMKKEILDISGVNEELLGSAEDDKAGILSQLRQGAGLVTLQVFFDNLDMTQKLLGQVMIELIQENFSEGKIRRILNQEPANEFRNKSFGKYDCSVAEATMTTNQKQLQYLQLAQLREMGYPIPFGILIDTLTLQNKKQLTEAIEKEQKQQSQMQQMQFKLEMENRQVVNNSIDSKSYSDKSLGKERTAKIALDAALNMERMARAQEDIDSATLARIKAAKELTTMDLDNLYRTLEILKNIQGDQEEEVAEKQRSGGKLIKLDQLLKGAA